MKLRFSAVLLCVVMCFAPGARTDEAVFAPGENLVVEGIPPIPMSLADDVDRYSYFRTAGISSWHPSRREMLIETRFADTAQVHELKMPGGARTQLTFYRDAARGASYPPGNGAYFVFSKDRGGDEFYQKYRYDLANGSVTLLTDGKSRNTGGVWSNAGEMYAYGSTRRDGKDVDLWVVKAEDPKSDHMVAQVSGGGWDALDWSPDDRSLLVEEDISANESYLWLCDAKSGEMTAITPRDTGGEKIVYSGGRFSKDGKGIYTATDKGSEFKRLTYIDLATKKASGIGPRIDWDVDELALSKDGEKLAFVTNENGIGVLHVMKTGTRAEIALPKIPVGTIGGIRWHNNSRDLAFDMSSARAANDVYSIDIANGKLERWTSSETGGIPTESFAEPKLIQWKSFDGRMISGFLYMPPAKFSGKRPVMVDIHGGPEGQARPDFLYQMNYVTNELGVAIIFPNVRGSSGYGKTFLALDNGFLREDTYKDINALFDWIGTQADLDADRIDVQGGSYGGHMTLAVSTFYSGRIRCAVDIVGMSNLVTFLEHTQEYRRDLRRVEYGDERDPKMRAFLERIAPMNHIQMIQKPMLVVAGKNDPRVPASESEQIAAALKKNGTPVWFLMANDEGHGFGKKKNRDFLSYSMVEFLKRYLLN